MAEYIDKDVAINTIMGQPPDAHYPDWYASQIEDIPAADVVPVVHAKWIPYRCDMYECSACGRIHTSFDNEECDANYCPHCGAKMDGGDEHG